MADILEKAYLRNPAKETSTLSKCTRIKAKWRSLTCIQFIDIHLSGVIWIIRALGVEAHLRDVQIKASLFLFR